VTRVVFLLPFGCLGEKISLHSAKVKSKSNSIRLSGIRVNNDGDYECNGNF
jgi:hypothetical protein